MKLVIYLHGFGSVGVSTKSEALRKMVEEAGHEFYAPDLPLNPTQAIRLVSERITTSWFKYDKIILVGTSLGGFLARIIGESFDIPYVLVNPATHPYKYFGDLLDLIAHGVIEAPKNYVTNAPLNLTPEIVNEFREYESAFTKSTGNLVHLFLARDDDVLPYVDSLEFFTHVAHLEVFNDGGHRFEAHWDTVVSYVTDLLTGR